MTLTPEQTAIVAAIVGGVVGAGIKGVWVWGWVYKALEKRLLEQQRETQFWRGVALKAMGHTDQALDVAAKATDSKANGDGA